MQTTQDEGKPSLTKYHIYWSTLLSLQGQKDGQWMISKTQASNDWDGTGDNLMTFDDNQAICDQWQSSNPPASEITGRNESSARGGAQWRVNWNTAGELLHFNSMCCCYTDGTHYSTLQCTATVHSLQCTTQRWRKVHHSEAKYCLLRFFAALQGKVEFAPHWSSKQFNYRDRTGSEN